MLTLYSQQHQQQKIKNVLNKLRSEYKRKNKNFYFKARDLPLKMNNSTLGDICHHLAKNTPHIKIYKTNQTYTIYKTTL